LPTLLRHAIAIAASFRLFSFSLSIIDIDIRFTLCHSTLFLYFIRYYIIFDISIIVDYAAISDILRHYADTPLLHTLLMPLIAITPLLRHYCH
jgi:hypothetical protein